MARMINCKASGMPPVYLHSRQKTRWRPADSFRLP
jgi:hypothetical protein